MATVVLRWDSSVRVIDVSDEQKLANSYSVWRPGAVVLVFFLSFCTAILPILNTVAFELFNPARLLAILAGLTLVHILLRPQIFWSRELTIYALLVGYTGVSVLWAPSSYLALNTILPSINFLLLAIMFGSLFRLNDLRPVICGILAAFVIGAVSYTYSSGFPFQRPDGFSYNAFAVMYLSGLYCALIFGLICGSRVLAGTLALVFLLHIVATTSIKTNLGLAAGVFVVSMIFFLRTARIVARNAVYLVLLGAVLVYAIASSDELSRRVDVGIQRISLGVEILQSREDQSGSTSYGLREEWTAIGLEGWARNPVFGEGVEAFRATHGAHSHTVPVELLYNTGLIGFILFYGVFASLAIRVIVTGHRSARNLHALVVAGAVCYMLMTFGGTPQYEYYLGIFLATSVALLERTRTSRGSGVDGVKRIRAGATNLDPSG